MASRFLAALEEFAARQQRLNQTLAGLETRPDLAPTNSTAERLAAENKELRRLLARHEQLLAQIEKNTAADGTDRLTFVS